MRFIGTYKELKDKLNFREKWDDLNENHKRVRLDNGVIVNWYPTTGTIALQGSGPLKEVEIYIVNVLENKSSGAAKKQDAKKGTLEKNGAECRKEVVIERNSELVIGLVGAVGTDLGTVDRIIKDRLMAYKYQAKVIRVSQDVIDAIYQKPLPEEASSFERTSHYMDLGNIARKNSGENSILAMGAAAVIMRQRESEGEYTKPKPRTGYIINSLKHPEEVERLREIYSNGFYLIGISADEKSRYERLTKEKLMKGQEADQLIARDMEESLAYGQHTRDTFHLADFFVHYEDNNDKVKKSLWRVLDLIFGNPYLTPTFDEFAMFMAFTSALRSGDLSRQVGAVIARNNEIIASGANDCPKAGGGLYWPEFNANSNEIEDKPLGRDFKRGEDSNKIEQAKIIDNIIQCLELTDEAKEKLAKSKIRDITEYGRVVHAEMEALLMCARNNTSTREATLYCTTFPCHNCAKHIIAAGIKKVFYVEPYPKSKAFEFHSDSITPNPSTDDMVEFLPFVGVGPRKFFELFSMSLSSGYNVIRKDSKGYTLRWERENAQLRCQMLPFSYLEKEFIATTLFSEKRGEINA